MLAPGFVKFAGIDDLAAAYTKETGIKVTVKSTGMGEMMNTIKTGSPAADVVMLPQNLMDQLSADKGVVAGSRKELGRVQIVLIVPTGRHISTFPTPPSLLRRCMRLAMSPIPVPGRTRKAPRP